MSLEYDITAARSFKKIAEDDARAGKTASAVNYYNKAAKKYRQAAEEDEKNKYRLLDEADACEQAAQNIAAPASSSRSNGGSGSSAAPKKSANDNYGSAVKNNSSGETSSKAATGDNQEQKPKPTIEEALGKLNSLVGLERVKSQINAWVDQLKVFKMREENGLPVPDMSYHMVFTGNPGTGKTTVARIVSSIYCALGILSEGQLVEVERNDLVAGYVGQTAIKTKEVIEKATGGVLFVDEAYTLSKGGNDFGQEAIDTLLKAMEDHRDDFVVVVAGYDDLMANFINSNPGLKSRFKTYIKFDDYTGQEMFKIFMGLCNSNKYVLAEGVDKELMNYFNKLYKNRDKNFGNGRDVRNMFEKMVTTQSTRIAKINNPSMEQMMTVTLEDLSIG